MLFNIEDVENTPPLLMATTKIYLETEDSYSIEDLYADVEHYYDSLSKEKAREELIKRMKDILMKELDNVGYEHFWEYFNMDDIIWIKKEGL